MVKDIKARRKHGNNLEKNDSNEGGNDLWGTKNCDGKKIIEDVPTTDGGRIRRGPKGKNVMTQPIEVGDESETDVVVGVVIQSEQKLNFLKI